MPYNPVDECKAQLEAYSTLLSFTTDDEIFSVMVKDTLLIIKPLSNGFEFQNSIYESVTQILMLNKDFRNLHQQQLSTALEDMCDMS
jgi:hypothetical protein